MTAVWSDLDDGDVHGAIKQIMDSRDPFANAFSSLAHLAKNQRTQAWADLMVGLDWQGPVERPALGRSGYPSPGATVLSLTYQSMDELFGRVVTDPALNQCRYFPSDLVSAIRSAFHGHENEAMRFARRQHGSRDRSVAARAAYFGGHFDLGDLLLDNDARDAPAAARFATECRKMRERYLAALHPSPADAICAVKDVPPDLQVAYRPALFLPPHHATADLSDWEVAFYAGNAGTWTKFDESRYLRGRSSPE